jgi:hypothetical protein
VLLITIAVRHFQLEIDLVRRELDRFRPGMARSEEKIEIIRGEQMKRIEQFSAIGAKVEVELNNIEDRVKFLEMLSNSERRTKRPGERE